MPLERNPRIHPRGSVLLGGCIVLPARLRLRGHRIARFSCLLPLSHRRLGEVRVRSWRFLRFHQEHKKHPRRTHASPPPRPPRTPPPGRPPRPLLPPPLLPPPPASRGAKNFSEEVCFIDKDSSGARGASSRRRGHPWGLGLSCSQADV